MSSGRAHHNQKSQNTAPRDRSCGWGFSGLIDGTLWNHPVTKSLSEIVRPVEWSLFHLVHRYPPRLLWRHLGRIVAQDQSPILWARGDWPLTLIACPAWAGSRLVRIAFESRALIFGLEIGRRKTKKIKILLTRRRLRQGSAKAAAAAMSSDKLLKLLIK
jgi:hypothetical protein